MKEMISMTLMGQLLMEDGMEKGMERGREQGEFKTLQELVRKKMAEAKFQKRLGELQLG